MAGTAGLKPAPFSLTGRHTIIIRHANKVGCTARLAPAPSGSQPDSATLHHVHTSGGVTPRLRLRPLDAPRGLEIQTLFRLLERNRRHIILPYPRRVQRDIAD